MSLDCYPLEAGKTFGLSEQPMALDVAYDENLFISATDACKTIIVFDLNETKSQDDKSTKEDDKNKNPNNYLAKFSLGSDIVISQLVYCKRDKYIACIGHKNGKLSVYSILNWYNQEDNSIKITELNFEKLDQTDEENEMIRIKREKLNYIDCCQRTGNLAVSFGEIILIYQYLEDCPKVSIESPLLDDPFRHIITINLSICAQKVNLLENYLAVTSIDHVQVLKLELLTLQIEPDGPESECPEFGDIQNAQKILDIQRQQQEQQKDKLQKNNSGDSQVILKGSPSLAARSDTVVASTTTDATTTIATTTSCSMISDSASTGSNYSSFTTNNDNAPNNNCGFFSANSDISIITMNHQHQQVYIDFNESNNDSSQSTADDCISWNLNTKKLIKLPTLMHNTSTNLSSYHICHPVELLGPASESIACRLSGSIYSPDYCQNQLETVVMLCRQFDFERDPIKSTHLKAVYLSSVEDLKRLNKFSNKELLDLTNNENADNLQNNQINSRESNTNHLLKSKDFELLASVTCFVSTITNCFVYSLNGKRGVVKSQTITHPDLCLDLRPDLLNVYLLSPLGLQICTSGICNSTFRYEWSSTSDLNLSFIASNQLSRVLTTKKYVLLIGSSANNKTSDNIISKQNCLIECFEKPNLSTLYERIIYTVNRCNSISIRSNMLTYLHACSQLNLLDNNNNKRDIDRMKSLELLKSVTIMLAKQLLQKKQTNVITNGRIEKAIKHLLDISCCDLKELMERHWESLVKKSMNQNQNQTYQARKLEAEVGDEQADSSEELLQQRLQHDQHKLSKRDHHSSVVFNSSAGLTTRRLRSDFNNLDINRESACDQINGDHNEEEDDEEDGLTPDTDYELIKIYLKYAKFSQSLLDYLIENSSNEPFVGRVIDYIFEHNPRLLIKCAQRYPLQMHLSAQENEHSDEGEVLEEEEEEEEIFEDEQREHYSVRMLLTLVDKLKLLAELDSTGINRSTVLFTLAILYNALDERQKCLLTMDQIKPSNHLAITMCSNYEHSHSIAKLVMENYPDVYRLFISQLSRKDKLAAKDYVARHGDAKLASLKEEVEEVKNSQSFLSWRDKFRKSAQSSSGNSSDEGEEDNLRNNDGNESAEDEQEVFDLKLKLLSEIPTWELVDILCNSNDDEDSLEDRKFSYREYIEASIKLLESQFILARLRENSN